MDTTSADGWSGGIESVFKGITQNIWTLVILTIAKCYFWRWNLVILLWIQNNPANQIFVDENLDRVA